MRAQNHSMVIWNSQVQPGTVRYGEVKPDTARYGREQPGTARHSQTKPGTGVVIYKTLPTNRVIHQCRKGGAWLNNKKVSCDAYQIQKHRKHSQRKPIALINLWITVEVCVWNIWQITTLVWAIMEQSPQREGQTGISICFSSRKYKSSSNS